MAEMKRLLVATDLSDRASDAIERAARIARDVGARLDLVHVSPPVFVDSTQPLVDQRPVFGANGAGIDVHGVLQQQAAEVEKRHGISCGVYWASGSLIDELVSHADELAADLLVLGFSGAGLMRQMLLGSTAERMLTKLPCPILVVKQRPEGPYRSVLVPVDLSPVSIAAIVGARWLAPAAAMSVLHVFEAPFEGVLRYAGVEEDTMVHYRAVASQETLEQMTKLCADAGLDKRQVRLLAIHGVPSLRIVAREAQQNVDLIVMGKQDESVLESLFLGSVTRRVVARSRCDVLICPGR